MLEVIETALRTALINDAAVAAIVARRVHPRDGVPQGVVYPYISFFNVSTLFGTTLDRSVSRLRDSIYQLDLWGYDDVELRDLREKVLDAISGLHGGTNAVQIDMIQPTQAADVEEDDEPGLYHCLVEFRIVYRRAA